MEIAQQIGDRHGEALSLFNQAIALAKLKKYPDAIQSYQHAKQMFEKLKLAHMVEQCDTEISNLTRRKSSKIPLWFYFCVGLAIVFMIWWL
ncbi:MAG TPA: tetratricopeptide repeat protein [Oscillatoriales cyanobacterium M59_W2019_021]|nr:MAG: tetratricopeptide repeat protein [Cyanobacteria bacterium J055]HIK34045.1 tetratricopeptide repeat protein [Oscillatoriales cyanobacterium M4454_W2019_049]HIK53156.1 tetratricopeptide repeat protein [Oscillatoriales cyanobacterium M59_W2019_021]